MLSLYRLDVCIQHIVDTQCIQHIVDTRVRCIQHIVDTIKKHVQKAAL
jgi:hypothetical protein